MEIKCTVEEFGKIVRRCSAASCYSCAFADLCGEIEDGKIERYVSEITFDSQGNTKVVVEEFPEG